MIIKLIKHLLSWGIGIFFLISGLSLVSNKSYLMGFIVILGAILILPFFGKFLLNLITAKVFMAIKIAIVIILVWILFIGVENPNLVEKVSDNQSSTNINSTSIDTNDSVIEKQDFITINESTQKTT